MKKILILVVVMVVALGAILLVTSKKDTVVVLEDEGPEVQNATESQKDYGYSFSYQSGKDGYVVVTQEEARAKNLVFAQSLFVTKEYEELAASTIPREAPASLSIGVYRNPMNLEVEEWIKTVSASNFDQSTDGTFVTKKIGNTNFSTYTYDGLYRTEAFVYGQEGYIYMISNMWSDPASPTYAQAQVVLQSLTWSTPLLEAQIAHGDIKVSAPTSGQTITSPLTVTGEARGTWFFEASFPLILTNWDGLIIAEGFATADGEWMTEEFVPFTGELTFTKPAYGERGTLILKKDNPSGLPEHDDAIEIPVLFK